jgi:hypothetical protein
MKAAIFFLIIGFIFLGGCASNKNIYYWGDYSETLYAFKKNPDDKTAAAHKKMLLKIIDESPKKNKQVPPGVFAEYGYMLIQEGKGEEGMPYLDKEATVYPESVVFIQRLKDELARGKK